MRSATPRWNARSIWVNDRSSLGARGTLWAFEGGGELATRTTAQISGTRSIASRPMRRAQVAHTEASGNVTTAPARQKVQVSLTAHPS